MTQPSKIKKWWRLRKLGQLKTDQRHMFYNIIERLKEVKGHCKNCGNNILNLNQKICEFCGLDLNKI